MLIALTGFSKNVAREKCKESGPDHLLQIIFADVHGMPLVRDMPDLAISAAKDYLLCSEPSLQSQWVYERHLELEPLFGLRKTDTLAFFPQVRFTVHFCPSSSITHIKEVIS